MSKANLLATALILGWIASIAGCGGTDDSSTDSTSGAGGNEAVGGSDGAGGSPNELPAVKGDDGQWHCTEAGMALSTEKKEPPVCTTQTSVIEPDAAPPPDSTTESPADMGTEPTPDAATECRDWSEQLCVQQGATGPCVLLPAEPQPGWPCLWNCANPDHREIIGTADIPGDDIPATCPNIDE